MLSPLEYLSICSGIEAASVAWEPLGWRCVACAEIEAFPSAVLAHHYPKMPNWGDITKFRDWPDAVVNVLVGGTPCQSFSVAGLRKGLADPRGNLCLTFLAIADRYRPDWLLWENVPGVLSSNGGRDFGAFLGGLGQLGYGWAYRVLDAQYVRVDGFGRAVPQRRRRVFVVGYLGDWRRAAAVLFEPESLSGNPPPRRQAGEGAAPTLAARTNGGGGLGTDFDCDGGLLAGTLGARSADHPSGLNHESDFLVAQTLNAGGHSRNPLDGPLVAHSLRADGFDASEDGTGRGTPLVAASLTRGAESAGKGGYAGRRQEDDVNLICFDARQSDVIQYGDKAGPIDTDAFSQAVAFDNRGRDGGAQFEGPHDTANIRAASGGSSHSFVARQWAVRRLTPLECERLQGFPDGYTAVPYRGRRATDGPRYKGLGNSMATNVMRWHGRRIDMVRRLAQ